MNRNRVLLLLLALALGLRLYGLRLGLPSETGGLTTLHPDESVTFYSLEAMKPAKLDFYPGAALNWGTFHLYTVGALAKAMEATGAVKLGSRADLKRNLREVDKLYLMARLLSVAAGLACVWLLYRIGLLFLEPPAAFASAFLMAAAQVPVMLSGLVKTDSLMMAWALASVYFSFRLMRDPSRRNYLLTGIFFGLAFITKYSAALLAFFPFAAHVYRAAAAKDPLHNAGKLAGALLAGFAVFLVCNPYFLLRTQDELVLIFGNVSKASVGGAGPGSYPLYFLSVLPAGIGWALAAFSLAAAARWLRGPWSERKAVGVYCALFLAWAGATSEPRVVYVFPVAPFLFLAAGDLACALWRRRWGRWLTAAVFAHTLLFTAAVRHNWASGYTIAEADAWLAANVPAGATVAIPKNDAWTPAGARRHTAAYGVLEAAPSSALQWEAVAALAKVYRKADYLVLAEWEFRPLELYPGGYPAEAAALREILAGAEEVKRFSRRLPRWALPYDPDLMGLHVNFMDPEIRIYKVRKG